MTATTTPAAANETAAAIAAWAEKTLGCAAPEDRNAPHAEWYDPATVPADVYMRSLSWMARRYVKDMTSARPAAQPKKPKADSPAPTAVDTIRDRIKTESAPRTGGNDHQGLSYAELIARGPDAAADYYHGAIVRLSTPTLKRGETVARNGWQRANVGANDHARAVIVIAQQARRANWRTAETQTGGGRSNSRGRNRYPYIHGMSATGDNPAVVASICESYARDGRSGTGHSIKRGRRPTVSSPAPETPYRIAQAEALAALMGLDQTESMTAPKTAHTVPGGLAQIDCHTIKAIPDGTATLTTVDHIGPDTMPCLVNGTWKRIQTGWTAYTTTKTIERHRYTMTADSRTHAAYDPATVNDIDHVGEIIQAVTDWNPTHFPTAPAVPALTIMDGKLFHTRAEGGAWHTVEGEIVSTTHRPRPGNAQPTPDTIAGYQEIAGYLKTVPTQTYKDWDDTAVPRIADAFQRVIHDQKNRSWKKTIGEDACRWWFNATAR